MEAIAKTRHLKGSPRKARLVIDLIRGRNVSQALNILKFTDKRAADPISKTLRSAIANATYLAEQQNIAIDPDDLFVKTCFVDMGAHKNRRRMRPAPQGRAFREQRHYCHITILVSSDAPVETKSSKKSLQTAGEKGDGGAKTKKAPKLTPIETAKKDEPTNSLSAESSQQFVENQPPVVAATVIESEAITTPTSDELVNVELHDNKTVEQADSVNESANQNAARVEKDGDAEASDAKNVQSQTPAERNETKKADNAQLKDNDILELQ